MKPKLRVSDHAVVRYLERAGGFDIDALRAAIARRVEPAAYAGAGATVIDGLVYTIRHDQGGPVVTSVVPRSSDFPDYVRRRTPEDEA